MTEQTKFEQDLEVFFPDIYKLHQLGKWDKWVWSAIYSMLDMAKNSSFGEVRVTYQRGRINQIYTTKSETSREVQADGFAVSSEKK